MSQVVYVQGGKCPGGKCPGGNCPGGICPLGKCPGGTCPGGLCSRTVVSLSLNVIVWIPFTKFLLYFAFDIDIAGAFNGLKGRTHREYRRKLSSK